MRDTRRRYDDGISWERRCKLLCRYASSYFRSLAKCNEENDPSGKDVLEFYKWEKLLKKSCGWRGK